MVKTKKTIAFILTAILLANSLVFLTAPVPAKANVVTSTASSFTGCATGGILAGYLSDQLKQIIPDLQDLKNIFKDNVPNIMNVPVHDTGTNGAVNNVTKQQITKAYVDDVLARCAARTILQAITGNAFEIMQTHGRDGGVTFIKNWSNLETQAQYRGENIFRAELSTARLCPYFSNSLKQSYGVRPTDNTKIAGQDTRIGSLQPFSLQANCTLPNNFSMTNYQNNFAANGGWDAWSRILQPQNNPYGMALLSQNEITKQRALQQSADVNQATAGKGYLGTSGTGKSDSCSIKSPATGACVVYNNIKTTGSYIADNIVASVNAELTWLTSAQELNTIIANATEALLGHLLDEGDPSASGKYTNDITNINSGVPPQVPLCPDGSEPTVPTAPPLCMNSGDLSILKSTPINVVAMMPDNAGTFSNDVIGTFRFTTFRDLIAWLTPNWPPLITQRILQGPNQNLAGFSLANLEAMGDIGRAGQAGIRTVQESLARANNPAQLANDNKLTTLSSDFGSLFTWLLDSNSNKNTLTSNNDFQTAKNNVLKELDDLLKEPACGATPTNISPSASPTCSPSAVEPPTGGTGLTCDDVPTANSCAAPGQVDLVQQVANYVAAQGIYTLTPDDNWCGRLEISKRVACAVGAGLLASYHNSSCDGVDARFIAYPDNSELKILNDSGPIWEPAPAGTDPGVHYTGVDCSAYSSETY